MRSLLDTYVNRLEYVGILMQEICLCLAVFVYENDSRSKTDAP
jgi:hypothetical protein